MKNIWYNDIINEKLINNYFFIDNLMANNSYKNNLNENLLWSNSEFVDRAKVKFTTTYVETENAYSIFDTLLNKYNISTNSVIFDIGCGDGRLIKFLSENKFNKILGLDLMYNNLLKIKNNKSLNHDKILLIADDFYNLPVKPQTADVIFLWGVLTCLPDHKRAFETVKNVLKKDGIIILIEPILESVLIYSLVRNDLNEFIRSFLSSSRATYWNDKENRYDLYTSKYWEGFVKTTGMTIIDKLGINIFPSLLFGAFFQDNNISNEKKEEICALIPNIIDLCPAFNRQIIYVLQ
jgi:SAM-dependent methyltransferase